MGTSLINIGISGLNAQQAALATTGHNITNASTPGYSRQRVEIQAHAPQYSGTAYIGRGAMLASITRVASDYATNQIRLDTATSSGLDTFVDQIGQVDSLLADDQTGLAPALQTFFGALQAASTDPSSIPSRQLVVSDANGLVSRFNTMYERLNSQQIGLQQQLSATTLQVNQLAQCIGQLNDRIAAANGRSTGVLPNDLLDQRDELLRQLSQLVDVKVVQQSDGDLGVFIGKGQPLILGDQARSLQTTATGQVTITTPGASQAQDITDSITGGQLGGLLTFRNGVLDGALNQLGRIAIGLSDAINQQHHKGVTLDGQFGGDLFSDINDPTVASQRAYALGIAPGFPPGQMSVNIDSPSQLTTSDYELRFDPVGNGSFSLVRLSDKAIVAQGSVAQGLPARVSADGFTLTIQSGQFHGGDHYLVQPTRSGARDIAQLISSPADLAFSSPVAVQSGPANEGSGVIVPSAVFDAANPSFAVPGTLTPPLLIRFTGPSTYEVLDNSDPAAPKPLQPPLRNVQYVPGVANALLPAAVGATRLASDGANIERLVNGGAPSLGIAPLGNGYAAQLVTIAQTDANGLTMGTQTVAIGANASARVIAAALSQVSGVAASAQTTVAITGIHDNGTGVPLSLVVSGQRFIGADVASLNALADAINANPHLQAAGITAASNGTRLNLIAAQGDDLNLNVSGDSADSITLAGPNGDTSTLNGAGAGVTGQLVGNVDRSFGFDFSTGGPYSFSLGVDGSLPQTITLSGTYGSGAALATALQSAIDASSIGPGRVAVGVDGLGHVSLASTASGAGGSIAVGGAPAGSAIANALGIGDSTSTGTDLTRGTTIGGSVAVSLDANYRFSTDATTVGGGVFTASPTAVRADFGYQLTLNGRPQVGDTFAVGFNTDGVSDNVNALAMTDVQSQKLFGRDGSLFDAYANIVESIGAQTSQATIDRDAADGLLKQSQAQRDSVAGVNLDEEAADLIRFQQAYNASARVIAVARDTFDTLFQLIGS
jgi:flagellar hook-associated protein 1 FlgK